MSTPFQDHVARWKDCQGCALACQRNRIVLARGQIPASVIFLGEAPGISEDTLGVPFIGPAGKLLDKIIDNALDPMFDRDKRPTIAFTNLVCCFPKEAKTTINHQPDPLEIKACQPRLTEFISTCKPRLVVCVGLLAAQWGRKMRDALGLNDVTMVDITHPAAILRAPDAKKSLDIQKCVLTIANAIEKL